MWVGPFTTPQSISLILRVFSIIWATRFIFSFLKLLVLFITATRFKGPEVTTVTGMATPTPTIPVTVDTFHNCKKIRGSKSDDSYRDGDADPHDPCDC